MRFSPRPLAGEGLGVREVPGNCWLLPDPQAGAPPANHHLWCLMVASNRHICPRTQETQRKSGDLRERDSKSASHQQW